VGGGRQTAGATVIILWRIGVAIDEIVSAAFSQHVDVQA
jgi:hypothetical protein